MVSQKKLGPKRKRARLTQELRREIVLGLRLQGLTDQQIAARIKSQYGANVSYVTVNRDWKAALASRRDENDEDFIDLLDTMNARYERQIAAWWAKSLAGDYRAAEIILRNLKAIRELNGLDADLGTVENPFTYQVENTTYDYSQLTQEERRTLAALGQKAKVVNIEDARQRYGSG